MMLYQNIRNKDSATEGSVLKYANGIYEYYSNDGFERAEKIRSSKT